MTVKELEQLAKTKWEGCHGCDENDKYFFIKGFQVGYNRAKPDELSDKEILNAAKESRLEDLITSVGSFELGAQWYREQLKAELRYKDGTPMKKYNSPKLQAIEMEISDDEIEKRASEWMDEWIYMTHDEAFIAGVKWYREQLKNIDKKL